MEGKIESNNGGGEIAKRVGVLGAFLHDEWRASRKKEDSEGYEPRVKILVEDADGKQTWVNEDQVPANSRELDRQDIANTNFADLRPKWQFENMDAATWLVKRVEEDNARGIDTSGDAYIETTAARYHNENWRPRAKASGWIDPKLDVDYAQLEDGEKEKDKVHVRKTIEICAK